MTREERNKLNKEREEEFLKLESSYEKECFDTNSSYFQKMIKLLGNAKERGLEKEMGYELHHKIPRSFFKKKGLKVVDNGNLYKLTYEEHFLVHFYAYKCATKYMKSSMCLALMQMKKVCTMNTNDVDTEKLAKIFDSIKTGLYKVSKKSPQDRYFKQSFQKVDSLYGGKFELLKSTHIDSPTDTHTIYNLRCRRCGKTFTIQDKSYFLEGTYKCDCDSDSNID